MKSAKLLILAYRSHKKNLPDISSKLFIEAMTDKTAPRLMEKLYKLIKADDSAIDQLSEESSTKLGWDEETESWNLGDEDLEEEGLEEEGEGLGEESEELEDEASQLLKRAQEMEMEDEDVEEESEETEEFGETGDENKIPIAKVQVSAQQYAQLKAIANKLACKSSKGSKLAHTLLASLKVKKGLLPITNTYGLCVRGK